MKSRVLVTGCSMITSLGLDLPSSWEGLAGGRSGVGTITRFDPAALATRIAAQVPGDFDDYSLAYCKRRVAKQMTRVTRMAVVSAMQAVADSGVDFSACDRLRAAVVLGIVHTGFSSVEEAAGTTGRIVKAMNNAPAAWISMQYGLEGPSFPVSAACASSAYALGLARDLIQTGKCDVVIAGGADSTVNPEEIQAFNELMALSVRNAEPAKASRPFCADRDGFVIGEGAGALVLESEEHARGRGAQAYAEFAGYGLTSEAYSIVSPKPDAEGMARTMELAMACSGVGKEDVGYINAHGTSTPLNDRTETMAIKKVLGDRAYAVPVSSTKSMLGHTIGAAGAIEAVTTAMTVKTGLITPTINYDNPDPELDLDYVPNQARRAEVTAALSNSFAFGGHNATLVFRAYA